MVLLVAAMYGATMLAFGVMQALPAVIGGGATRQLFHGPRATELFLPKKPFARLIELIRPKFLGVVLPIPDVEPIAVSVPQHPSPRQV
jgi:hypothetical protein